MHVTSLPTNYRTALQSGDTRGVARITANMGSNEAESCAASHITDRIWCVNGYGLITCGGWHSTSFYIANNYRRIALISEMDIFFNIVED